MKKRTIKHTVLYTPAEDRRLQEESNKLGMKTSVYIRDRSLNGRERNSQKNKFMCTTLVTISHGIDAIYDFGVMTNSDDVKKFTSALIQSLERGGGDLPKFLTNQSAELWAHRRQYYLQKGEKAASALLMPIALLFMGVIIIVIAAAMRTFSF